MAETDNIYTKLRKLQVELKVPKSQRNNFGNYNYRNAEDILEAVKPLCDKYKLVLVVSDELVNIGDRYYVKATARVIDNDEEGGCEATGYAREDLDKKGMDESQITGAASSYARKYALNGLFAIDDTKDADTDEHTNQVNNAPARTYAAPAKPATREPSPTRLAYLKGLIKKELDKIGVSTEKSVAFIKTEFGYDHLDTEEQAQDVLNRLKGM